MPWDMCLLFRVCVCLLACLPDKRVRHCIQRGRERELPHKPPHCCSRHRGLQGVRLNLSFWLSAGWLHSQKGFQRFYGQLNWPESSQISSRLAVNHSQSEVLALAVCWKWLKPFLNLSVEQLPYKNKYYNSARRKINNCDWDFGNALAAASMGDFRYTCLIAVHNLN